MAIRFAAASGLALAAALIVASPARAQFFRLFETSPRQIAGMLEDEGYQLRGPLLRRGDVYVCDVTSISGRSVRLVVSARDGHILERYASAPRYRDEDEDAPRARSSHDFADDEDGDFAERNSRRDLALGDLFTPPSRVYGNDSLFSNHPTPPQNLPDAAAPVPKPKPHAAKKHKDPAIVKAPAPEPTSSAEAPKPDTGASVAAVAPNPAPEARKAAVEPVKPAALVEVPKPAAETKPAPAPTPVTTKAEVEKPHAAETAPVKPKPDAKPAKKLNDLPVGTLD